MLSRVILCSILDHYLAKYPDVQESQHHKTENTFWETRTQERQEIDRGQEEKQEEKIFSRHTI